MRFAAIGSLAPEPRLGPRGADDEGFSAQFDDGPADAKGTHAAGAIACGVQDSIDGGSADAIKPEASTDTSEGEPDRFPSDDRRLVAEPGSLDPDRAVDPGGGVDRACAFREDLGRAAEEFGSSGGAAFDAGRHRFQMGHDLGADRVPEQGRVIVGCVVTPLDAGDRADALGVDATDAQHRPDDPRVVRLGSESPRRVRTGKAARAGAPGKAHEHGLEHIVGVVPRGDEASALVPGDSGERRLAGAARVPLEVSGGACADACLAERDGQDCRDGSDMVAIGEGFALGADVMDDVCRNDRDRGHGQREQKRE